MKPYVLSLLSLLVLHEIQNSHQNIVNIDKGNVFLDTTESGEPALDDYFRYGYSGDVLALGSTQPNEISQMVPRLKTLATIGKNTSFGSLYNYQIDMCNEHSNLQKLNRDAENISKFIFKLGGAKPSKEKAFLKRHFFAKEIITNREDDVKKYFDDFDEEIRKEQEKNRLAKEKAENEYKLFIKNREEQKQIEEQKKLAEKKKLAAKIRAKKRAAENCAKKQELAAKKKQAEINKKKTVRKTQQQQAGNVEKQNLKKDSPKKSNS